MPFSFFYKHVPHQPWLWVNIVKPPQVQAIQDVLSLAEVAAIINTTRQLRYQVYYLTTYSLGLRLSETLNLTIADTNDIVSYAYWPARDYRCDELKQGSA